MASSLIHFSTLYSKRFSTLYSKRYPMLKRSKILKHYCCGIISAVFRLFDTWVNWALTIREVRKIDLFEQFDSDQVRNKQTNIALVENQEC